MSRTGVRLALLGAFVLALQLVPYGRRHENPPVAAEPAWDGPRTRELFFRACKDCHSRETRWPWYSHVAPASWLLQRDVDEGREHFDVSDWSGNEENDEHGRKAARMLRKGAMPPWFYLPLHPEARLSPKEEEELLRGLVATFGEEKPGAKHSHEH